MKVAIQKDFNICHQQKYLAFWYKKQVITTTIENI
jgi:hypothetical protein